jgi:undecaprenyl diphosphate synthase
MLPLSHVAIIMDGNGRWARQKHKPRTYGHKVGAENIQNILEESIKQKIKFLTLFAFSCENWNRPKNEVEFILNLVNKRMNDELLTYLNKNDICLRWIGFKDRIKKSIVNKIQKLERKTQNNKAITLVIAFNYGGQQDILQAAKSITRNNSQEFSDHLLTSDIPFVDLLIRTGGEKRLSNFLLWQSAYAEIIFEPTYWPAYDKKHFINNILEYYGRHRRFGKL